MLVPGGSGKPVSVFGGGQLVWCDACLNPFAALGLDHTTEDGERIQTGVAPNELTASEDRDWLAGTPWHKHVAARIEALA